MCVAVGIRTAVILAEGLCALVSAVRNVPWLILIFVFTSYSSLFDYPVVTRIVRRLCEVIY